MNNVESSSQLYDQPMTYKHSDPPWLWMTVFMGSISLHLLVFWCLRSSGQFQPWIPPSRQEQIPIDLIDIPPQVKSKSTAVKPSVSSLDQQGTKANLPKITVATPKNVNEQVIDSDINFSQQQEIKNSPVNHQLFTPQPTFTPEIKSTVKPQQTSRFTGEKKSPIKPQIKFTPTPIPSPTQTIPLNDLPWNRRQEVKLGRGTLLPNDFPSDSPTPTPENSPTPTPENSPTPPENSPTPTPENSPTPTPENSPTPTPENSPTPKSGGIQANIVPIMKDEIEQLRQDGTLRVDALPDVLAEYQGTSQKELEINIISGNSELKAANIFASLVIDKNGQFIQAVIINIEPGTLVSKRGVYEQALNDIFQQETFMAGYNQDGTKPELSNLYLRIKIEPINQSQ
jgi:hypothetical protein